MNLFAYGTLLVPEIWRAVTGRDCESVGAVLSGHEIRRIQGGDFPGIVRAAGSSRVIGRVFLGLDVETVARLDRYEDTFYERIAVTPRSTSGQSLAAQAYVVPATHADVLSNETWSLDWFRAHAEADYVRRLSARDSGPD